MPPPPVPLNLKGCEGRPTTANFHAPTTKTDKSWIEVASCGTKEPRRWTETHAPFTLLSKEGKLNGLRDVTLKKTENEKKLEK